MKITIVGAGNVGTQIATHCAEKGNSVTIYTSKYKQMSKELSVIDENGNLIHSGVIEKATDNCEEAFLDAELIFITLPAFCMKDISSNILPYVHKGMKICIVPGTGGGECAFYKCIEKGAIVFGLQRVPSVARLVEYGKCVRAVGYRETLHVASIPSKYVNECAKVIENIFDKKCVSISNYLNITMTPSNPILHTTRLKTLFNDYKEGLYYQSVPLFYEEWTDESSELLLKCDDEVQKICKSIEEIDLSNVVSLRVHYESPTYKDLTKKIRSITGFKGLKSPIIELENGYIPDLNSRYFTADFPYGLSILIQIAKLVNVEVPTMESVMNWYRNLCKNGKEYNYSDYGIVDYTTFIDFYLQ